MFPRYSSYIAECVGTLFLVYVILATGQPVPIGIALILAIMAVGNISGAHLNPAVTLVQVVCKKLPLKEFLPYVIAQGTGALIACELYRYTK